jgi:hypothetical protein
MVSNTCERYEALRLCSDSELPAKYPGRRLERLTCSIRTRAGGCPK